MCVGNPNKIDKVPYYIYKERYSFLISSKFPIGKMHQKIDKPRIQDYDHYNHYNSCSDIPQTKTMISSYKIL